MNEPRENVPGQKQQRSARRWPKILLVVSLSLNLLFIGAIVGAGWMRHKYGGGHGGFSRYAIKHVLKNLPENKRRAILLQIKRNNQQLRPRYEAMRKQALELKEVMKSEPFDPERVRLMANRLREIRRPIADAKMQLLVEVLGQLTPQERREVLDSRYFRLLFGRNGRLRSQRH